MKNFARIPEHLQQTPQSRMFAPHRGSMQNFQTVDQTQNRINMHMRTPISEIKPVDSTYGICHNAHQGAFPNLNYFMSENAFENNFLEVS